MEKSKFIGSGILFPIQLNELGRPPFNNTVELIKSSILMILLWPKNVRYFNENFGTRISELIEEPSDIVSKALLVSFIKDSLNEYEKRIVINTVDIIDYDLYKVVIQVNFKIRNTNIKDTLIFPYYKQTT